MKISLLALLISISAAAEVCTTSQNLAKSINASYINSAATSEGIPFHILLGICTVESDLNAHSINSDDGGSPSIGLCQLKLCTALIYDKHATVKKLLDPLYNARIAAKHLHALYNKYHIWRHAVAAYNYGTLKFNAKGLIWNRSYVNKVFHTK